VFKNKCRQYLKHQSKISDIIADIKQQFYWSS